MPTSSQAGFRRLMLRMQAPWSSGWPGQHQEVDHDAGGVEAKRLVERAVDHLREEVAGERRAVDVGDVGPEDQRRAVASRPGLKQRRGAGGELDRVGAGGGDGLDGAGHVLDAAEEGALVEHAVVDRDVEAVARRAEEAVHACLFHPVLPRSFQQAV
jgi:hypothetical protein